MIKNVLINYFKHKKKFKNNDIIVIYTMGKVASMTIQTSVEEAGFKTWTLHNITGHINNQIFSNYKNPGNFTFKEKIRNLYMQSNNKKALKILKNKKNFKIITIVREPISRNESFYFQDLHIPLCQLNKKNWTWVYNDNIDVLIEEYFANFNSTHGINWLDNEIKKHFGIDVYAYPFSKSEGYSIIKQKNMELLIIKLEHLNKCGNGVFNDFLGVDNFKLINQNIGQNKWYNDLYKEFKSRIEYSKEYVDSLYNSKYMQHFYSQEETEKFRSRLKIKD